METDSKRILILCSTTPNRLKYGSHLILTTLLGLKVELTTNKSEYECYVGAKLQYATQRIIPGGIFIYNSGFLEKTGIEQFEPDLEKKQHFPLLFPTVNSECILGFDIFAASFYLVSRYEEYQQGSKDLHGRFMAEESFAYRHGFLDIPLVNHYAWRLKKVLQHHFPFLVFKVPDYNFIPTYDIDVAYAYRGRDLIRGLGATIRSMSKFDFDSVSERIMVLGGKRQDPFDTYEMQFNWQKKYGFESYYFFLCGKKGPRDHNISSNSKAFKKLVNTICKKARIGIHPSYASANNSKLMAAETARLSKIAGKQINLSRQHYLKFTLPETYRLLIQNNIIGDFSMGYASLPGFRASIATPFLFYDLKSEEPTSLTIYPVAVMDGTLKDYMNLTTAQAISKISEIIAEVRKVNGTFISLWHNDSLSERSRWTGWRKVYELLLEMAAQNIKTEA